MKLTIEVQRKGTIVSTISKLLQNIRLLLTMIGAPDLCKGCRREIWWVKHPRTGKAMPITDEALSHFADCPKK